MDIELHEKQSLFFSQIFDENSRVRTDNDYYEFLFVGGFGSGKSMITMLCTFLIVAMNPGIPWLFARQTYQEMRDSVIPQFLELFPEKQCGYKHKKEAKEFHFNNGSYIHFRAFDKDEKILSNQYAGVTLCQVEQIEYALFLQIHGRLRHGKSELGKNILLMEGNPSAGWVKNRYKSGKVPKNAFMVEATTFDNPFLPKGYVERLIEIYPESWIRRYVYGEWSNLDEMVFDEFREEFHVIPPFTVIPSYKSVIGGDYGFVNPSAFIWMCRDYDGRIIIYDEFYAPGQSIEDLVLANRKHGKLPTVFDYSTKRPDRDGKSVWSDLEGNGIWLIESNKDETRNIVSVNSLFKQNKLFITSNCVNLIREIQEYKWKPEKIGDSRNRAETPIDKNNHAIDAMLYGIAYMEDVVSKDPSVMPYEKTLEYATVSKKKSDLYLA